MKALVLERAHELSLRDIELPLEVGDHDVGPFGDELLGRRAPHAGRAARHYRDAVLESQFGHASDH